MTFPPESPARPTGLNRLGLVLHPTRDTSAILARLTGWAADRRVQLLTSPPRTATSTGRTGTATNGAMTILSTGQLATAVDLLAAKAGTAPYSAPCGWPSTPPPQSSASPTGTWAT